MKLCFIGTLVGLVLSGLLGLPSIDLAEEGKWTKKADMLTPRCCLSTSVVNGKIYAIGGSQPWPAVVSTVEEYDLMTDTWTKKANMPTARMNLSTSAVNGKIYAIGGYIRADSAASIVEEYDPATDTWSRKDDMPTARSGFSTSVVNGKIYAIGGWGNWGNDIHLSTVEEYDPVKDRWRKKEDMPTARNGLSTGVINGKIYAIGGSQGGGVMPLRFLSSVEEYDPMTNTWGEKKKMPMSGKVYTSIVNGRIYVIGRSERPTIEHKIMEYDPVADTWTEKADILFGRWGVSISVVNGKIYVIGGGLPGAGDVLVSTVEEYDTDLDIEIKGKLATLWGKIKAED